MNKSTILFASILLITIVLATSITYYYCVSNYTSVVDSYKAHDVDLQNEINSLSQQNSQLATDNSQLIDISKPHLTQVLGWYLHKSDDPVNTSRNTLTIYGTIYNIGNKRADNTELTVKLYGNTSLLQQSTIHIGIIAPLASGPQQYYSLNSNIDCAVADQVANIQVTLNYS